MLETSLQVTAGSFKLGAYDGNSTKEKACQRNIVAHRIPSATKLNFFREEDNHAYVDGKVSYEEFCNNTLVISAYRNSTLSNVRNAFVYANKDSIVVFPISDIAHAVMMGKKALSNRAILYNIPRAVFERETLVEKDIERLKKEAEQKYRLKINWASKVNCVRTKNGIYNLLSEGGEEYALKFRGRDKKKAELQSRITQCIPCYFPSNFPRVDNGEFTFNIGGELYGLEEIIKKQYKKPRSLEYLSLVGIHMGILHNIFSGLLKKNNDLEKLLTPAGNSISESNIISVYLDLEKNKTENSHLLSELEKLVQFGLSKKIKDTPRSLIHGDLNYSNLIWLENGPKIIDPETIRISSRLEEFVPPLLFGGDMAEPEYIRDSIPTIINAYNQTSERPLSEEESSVLPCLLKYILIKNFVIRKIRRKNICVDIKETIKNLSLIGAGT